MGIWSILLIAAVAVVAAGMWLGAVLRLRTAAAQAMQLKSQLGKAEEDLQAARHEANQWRSQAESESRSRAVAETRLSEQDRSHREKIDALTAIRGEIEKDLKNIATDSLRANQSAFLDLANQVFDKHKEGASTQLNALVSPINETLQAYQLKLDEIEKARVQNSGALSAELKNVAEATNAVRGETSRLVYALRAAPKTRGRLGEESLRNALELAGLNAYCDFVTEQSYARDGALSRPDVVVRLPGGRSIIIDAKTPLKAYLDAVEAADDAERERHLALHAQQLRTQAKLLAGKAYWDGLVQTPDYVVMFVPGDHFYAAAAARDPDLFEFAAAQRVLIVTPATLIALLKAVAYGWRQEKVAENAKRVHELGRDLYKRLSVMGGHILALGNGLAGSVRKYNEFIGSLEGSVMPQARRFRELEVEGAGSELPLLPPVELEPRQLRADRDMSLAALPHLSTPEAAC